MRRLLTTSVLVAALAGATVVAPGAAATEKFASLTVTGEPGAKPTVEVAKPVRVKDTTREIVVAGTGEKARKGNKVTLDYLIVNGRTGAELESSYGQGSVTLVLERDQAQPVIVDHLIGTEVGSRVVIAIAPKEGLTEAASQQTDAIRRNDTLLFVVDVKDARTPLARATGEEVAAVDGLPAVKLGRQGKPTIKVPKGDAPAELVVQPLIKGDGPAVEAGQTITAHYTGMIWASGKQFDSSWARGAPIDYPIGGGGMVGWNEGLVGQTVGSQVLLVIPPDKGYGEQGEPAAGIKGTDTLVFVVDILDAA